MLTQAFLKEKFNYDPATGIFSRISKRCRNPNGVQDKDGYIRFRINGRTYSGHRMAWIYMNGHDSRFLIDHVNGDKSDNRIENLREATSSQNLHNAKRSARNTSGVKGVSWVPRLGKWVGRIHLQYKKHVVGYFNDIESAEIAMAAFREKLVGEFARHE